MMKFWRSNEICKLDHSQKCLYSNIDCDIYCFTDKYILLTPGLLKADI